MKTYTIADIRAMDPCYDPVTGINRDGTAIHEGGFLPEDWTGSVIDVLGVRSCSPEGRLWIALRMDISDDEWSTWARWSALQVIDLWAAPQIVKDYLETGNEELRGAAWDAAGDAAMAASGAAVRAATLASLAAKDARAIARAAWAARAARVGRAMGETQIRKLIEIVESNRAAELRRPLEEECSER